MQGLSNHGIRGIPNNAPLPSNASQRSLNFSTRPGSAIYSPISDRSIQGIPYTSMHGTSPILEHRPMDSYMHGSIQGAPRSRLREPSDNLIQEPPNASNRRVSNAINMRYPDNLCLEGLDGASREKSRGGIPQESGDFFQRAKSGAQGLQRYIVSNTSIPQGTNPTPIQPFQKTANGVSQEGDNSITTPGPQQFNVSRTPSPQNTDPTPIQISQKTVNGFFQGDNSSTAQKSSVRSFQVSSRFPSQSSYLTSFILTVDR